MSDQIRRLRAMASEHDELLRRLHDARTAVPVEQEPEIDDSEYGRMRQQKEIDDYLRARGRTGLVHRSLSGRVPVAEEVEGLRRRDAAARRYSSGPSTLGSEAEPER